LAIHRGLIGFQAILFLLQQKWKYKIVQILLICLVWLQWSDKTVNLAMYPAVWTISRCQFNLCPHWCKRHCSVALLYTLSTVICFVCTPVCSSCNTAILWHLHWQSSELIPASEHKYN
jgi:hypothetical protein